MLSLQLRIPPIANETVHHVLQLAHFSLLIKTLESKSALNDSKYLLTMVLMEYREFAVLLIAMNMGLKMR